MAVFNDVLTTEGQRFLMKMLSGETQNIQFTKLVLGDGNASGDLKAITAPVHAVAEVAIDSVTLSAQNDVTITAIFRNTDITEGFYMREKAIFATDGTEEVLVLYSNAGSLAEYIEPSTSEVYEKIFRSVLLFNQSDNVNITIDDVGYTSIIDFNAHLEGYNDHIGRVATGANLGHIKIGEGLQMSNGAASVKLTDDLDMDDSTTALSAAGGKKINANLAYQSINDKISINTANAISATGYVENGGIVIRVVIRPGIKGILLIGQITDISFRPRIAVTGVPHIGNSDQDDNKILAPAIEEDGNMTVWLKSELITHETIMFAYPKKIS